MCAFHISGFSEGKVQTAASTVVFRRPYYTLAAAVNPLARGSALIKSSDVEAKTVLRLVCVELRTGRFLLRWWPDVHLKA